MPQPFTPRADQGVIDTHPDPFAIRYITGKNGQKHTLLPSNMKDWPTGRQPLTPTPPNLTSVAWINFAQPLAGFRNIFKIFNQNINVCCESDVYI